MNILGISALYHDSAACLISHGEIIAAAQEERFSRKRHDAGFPINSIDFCLRQGEIDKNDIDYVVFYDKPFLKFERLFETYLAYAPLGYKSFVKSLPVWLKDKLFQKYLIINELRRVLGNETDWEARLLFSEHHLSHASSAFFPSPFESAAILTMDGVGEWTTTSIAHGNGNKLSILKEIQFPHSLGLLYSAMTYYTGFKVNSGEYKVMGLAPYGEPVYADKIRNHLIEIKKDGSFRLNMQYFNYCTGLTMTNNRFHKLFGGPPRRPESEITQREMDLAASIQLVTEEAVLNLARAASRATGENNLCLAGGVALNCVANGKIVKEGVFENIWIQPAAGDSGGALGAALAVHHLMMNGARQPEKSKDNMKGSYLGPEYSQSQIESELTGCAAIFETFSEEKVIEKTARALSEGKAVGWMNGRMEFGPRALGARSILGDARSETMQRVLNLKVKYRESFRPFAPSIMREHVSEWFELDQDSPYMLLVANVVEARRKKLTESDQALFGIDKLNVPKSDVPAVTHVDYSARIQTVHPDSNNMYYSLLKRFKEITGCPILLNTSFNIRGEPIVCSPSDAFNCFMGTELDLLVIGNSILQKEAQVLCKRNKYTDEYTLD
jgi:carbamoyltransferase